MRFDLITIFPDFFEGPLGHGIIRRARESGLIETHVHDLREWTHDRHRTVDDRPFGGGEGMVLKPEPLFEAVEALLGADAGRAHFDSAQGRQGPAPTTAIVLLSASGKLFRQDTARRLAAFDRIVLLCGRYEGVDERVAEHLSTDELSIGDFVLSGGELPAALVLDAVTRLLPGALGNEDSSMNESFSAEVSSPPLQQQGSSGQIPTTPAPEGAGYTLLDCPHYTRPAEFRGRAVPEILLSGNHEEIRLWRRKMALAKTLRNRPELLAGAALSEEDAGLLADLR
ncbi:MAG: tRNA (guanosine(37)-N1)-methyltransferase TrmD [Acidobacteria bacterium]|nr:tRNA (guanosine(37)-N1)-methyltransferase TrmD [Acidobacteriota bacterium]MBI3663917.1 tRNA (guanosine(37)-N1)-methyltransferase TrmD [Acidobacteriota bacterium]